MGKSSINLYFNGKIIQLIGISMGKSSNLWGDFCHSAAISFGWSLMLICHRGWHIHR